MTIGACFFGFGKKKKNANKEITLAIFGIDNAGKTTTTKSIRGDSLEVCPTMGFDLIEFSLDSYNVSMYDIGGSGSLRSIWNNYFSEIHGLVYVVDSCDTDRLDETRATLAALLQNELIQGKPVLLLANKQDSTEAMDEAEIVSSLRLSELACANRCPCRLERSVANIGTGAKMDKGIKTGLRWLLQYISLNWTDLDARVQRDKSAKAAKDAEEAAARKERVRQRREERERQEAAETAATADYKPDASPAAAAAADVDAEGDGDDNLFQKPRSRRIPKGRQQAEPLDGVENAIDRNQSDGETDQRSSSGHRRNRRHRRNSGEARRKDVDFEGDANQVENEDNDGNSSERRRRSRRSRRRELGDSVEAVNDGDGDDKSAPEGGNGDRKPAASSSSGVVGKTGRRHRRLAPVDGDVEGDSVGATATPTGLFEIGNSGGGIGGESRREGRGDDAGGSSGKLSRLPPLRGAQPNTDEVDHLT